MCVFHVLRCLHINSLTFLVASATLSLSLLLPFLPSDCLSVCLHRLDQPPRSYANGERTRAQRFSLTLFSLFFPYRHDICSNRSPRQRESELAPFSWLVAWLCVCVCSTFSVVCISTLSLFSWQVQLSLSPPFTYYPLATVAAWSVGLRWWQWWPLNALN